jgi:hypothetical protein
MKKSEFDLHLTVLIDADIVETQPKIKLKFVPGCTRIILTSIYVIGKLLQVIFDKERLLKSSAQILVVEPQPNKIL